MKSGELNNFEIALYQELFLSSLWIRVGSPQLKGLQRPYFVLLTDGHSIGFRNLRLLWRITSREWQAKARNFLQETVWGPP